MKGDTLAVLDALAAKYAPMIPAPYTIEHIDSVPSPHPFTIGPSHVSYASDHCAGILGEEALEKGGPCCWREAKTRNGRYVGACQLKYSEHVGERIVFIRCPEPLGARLPSDLHAALKALVVQATEDHIAGFGFLEPGKFHERWVSK